MLLGITTQVIQRSAGQGVKVGVMSKVSRRGRVESPLLPVMGEGQGLAPGSFRGGGRCKR